jgi:hypothetical protein
LSSWSGPVMKVRDSEGPNQGLWFQLTRWQAIREVDGVKTQMVSATAHSAHLLEGRRFGGRRLVSGWRPSAERWWAVKTATSGESPPLDVRNQLSRDVATAPTPPPNADAAHSHAARAPPPPTVHPPITPWEFVKFLGASSLEGPSVLRFLCRWPRGLVVA